MTTVRRRKQASARKSSCDPTASTHVGKDIAYQFWKLGLLGRDFHYRVFADRPHGPLWATSSADGEDNHPAFGGAAYVYNVIDVRQSHLQKLLKQALVAAGHPEAAERSHHFAHEMVALTRDRTRAGLLLRPTRRTPNGLSWRCRGAVVSASRRTTSSIR